MLSLAHHLAQRCGRREIVLVSLARAGTPIGVLLRRARALTLIAGIVIVAAVPLLPAWWLVMLAFGVLAIGGALWFWLSKRPRPKAAPAHG